MAEFENKWSEKTKSEIVEDMSNRLDKVNDNYMKRLEQLMEEMANAPREEMGQRQPGEKNTYERYNEHGRLRESKGSSEEGRD